MVRYQSGLKRGAIGLVALVFGGWLASLLFPHFATDGLTPPSTEFPSKTSTPLVPAAASKPDAAASTLGTDSSTSSVPARLMVVSTSPGRTVHEGTALLGTDARNPQTYGVGSILANGAVIREIRQDGVLLEFRGRMIEAKTDSAASSRAAQIEALSSVEGASPTVLEALAANAGGNDALLVGAPPSKSRVDRVASSRDSFSEVMRSQLVFRNDQLSGFKILPGTQPAALARLGLASGDIITTIAGLPVTDEDGWQVLEDAISTGTPIVVGLERDGVSTSMSIEGARLAQLADVSPASQP